MEQQFNIFDYLQEDVKITKPIRLIELFAGYGSQNLALKYLGAKYESWKICEWATKSIQAYKDLHHSQDNNDYSKELTFDEIKEKLFSLGISADYNKPMTYDQIKRKGESWCRNVYNNIIATNNLVNIQQVKGKDLNIIDTDKYDYVLTYSFPCQDLSLAGKGAGMEKGSGTRSGMLWEVERILKECDKLPHILLMENVTQIHSKKNKDNFNLWIKALNELGYASFWKDMNSKNYGVPQNRDRTFMISILKSYNSGKYEFPQGFKLELTLADMLEDEVDEKYYLSEKMINFFRENSKKNEEVGNGFRFKPINEQEAKIAKTITTRAGGRMDDNFIETVGKTEECHQRGNVYDVNYCSPTICVTDYKTPKLIIPENTKKGYAEAYEGDGVYINRPHQKRGVVQKGLIQTLKTSPDDVGVVVRVGNYSPSGHNDSSVVDSKGIAPTVMENHGTVTAIVEEKYNDVINPLKDKTAYGWHFEQQVYNKRGITRTIKAGDGSGNIPKVINNLRIRKLTPKECGRLMGVRDSDIDKMSKNQSNSSLYHLFGDSIVVDVLMNIFKKLL